LGRIGDRNYDIIFVQSVDGAISIYEQDSLVNTIALSEVIIPGPINFLTRKECFLISNTNYEIECYSYNNLATTTSSRAGVSAESGSDKKVINHTWCTELGELIREIKVIDNKVSKKQEIMILTETHVFLLDDNGKLIYQKKLDYEPMSLHVYNIDQNYLNMSNNLNYNSANLNGPANNQAQNNFNAYTVNKAINLMYMISTVMEHVFVYRGLELVWAVKLPETAVSVFLSDFDVNKNLITTLSDNGRLSVFYLGMQQYKSSKIICGNRNLDPAFMVAETERLGQLIQNYENGIQVLSSASVNISADVFSKIFYDNSTLNEKIFYTDSYGKIARAQVCLTFSFDGFLAENIKVNLITPNNVICDHPNFNIENLSKIEGDKKIYVNFRILNILFPSFTNVKVHATYAIKSKFLIFFY
jgi:Bardet-Biedl syndrome 9 protein